MPLEVIYRCWGCEAEKTEVDPSEDATRSEMIVWNLCPSCIATEKKQTNKSSYPKLEKNKAKYDISYYKCPVCNKTFKGNRAIANHIFSHCKYSQRHQDWIESAGISRVDINALGKAKLSQSFLYLINRECKQT